MTGRIDFTNCKRIIGKAHNGANGKKIAIEYDGDQYMRKSPQPLHLYTLCRGFGTPSGKVFCLGLWYDFTSFVDFVSIF